MASWKDLVEPKITSGTIFRKENPKGIKSTISSVDLRDNEKFGGEVLCLRLKNCNGFIPLSNKNCEVLSNAYGDDTDNWLGKTITLTTTKAIGDNITGYSFVITPMRKKGK